MCGGEKNVKTEMQAKNQINRVKRLTDDGLNECARMRMSRKREKEKQENRGQMEEEI